MEILLNEIRQCSICKDHLLLGTRPIVSAHKDSKIVIIGQAPRTKVHVSGIPWDDASGKQLRKWLGVTDAVFMMKQNLLLCLWDFVILEKAKQAIYHQDQNVFPNGMTFYSLSGLIPRGLPR